MAFNIENCNKGDTEYIIDKLVEYNLSKVSAKQNVLFDTLDKKITDINGNIIAGCIAKMYCWNVTYIDTLWIDENYRKSGLGTMLLNIIENTAKEKGCYLVHLDTFDFQAKEFYEKNGYNLFGVLEDCPLNHCRYYLSKKL